MTPGDTLEALALRCEREEPSLSLDLAIASALGWKRNRRRAQSTYVRVAPEPYARKPRRIPSFTASLDSAVTLVPPRFKDHWGAAQAGPDCIAHVGNQENEGPAKTPALALCAAALRTRAALKKEQPARQEKEHE